MALARTLVIEPELLLLDEPLSSLDAKLRVEMRSELKALQSKLGITTIYVTHDQEEANAVADRLAVLDGGRIQQIGTPLELYDRPANRFVAGFLGSANLIDGEIKAHTFMAGEFRITGLGAAPGAAAVSIRPQDITLSPSHITGIPAVIEHLEFLGGLTRYRVRAGEHRLIVDVPHRRDSVRFEVGAQVGLTIDPRAVAVLS